MNNISKGTIVRSALVIIVFLFLILKDYGIIPIDTGGFVNQLSTAVATVTALIAAWKNNSFTPAAIEADKVMERLKEK